MPDPEIFPDDPRAISLPEEEFCRNYAEFIFFVMNKLWKQVPKKMRKIKIEKRFPSIIRRAVRRLVRGNYRDTEAKLFDSFYEMLEEMYKETAIAKIQKGEYNKDYSGRRIIDMYVHY